jgi:IS4 transposase
MHAAQKISDIYALRWSIEIKFRAFKQICQLNRGLMHKSGHHHIVAMVLSAMLYQLLTIHLYARLAQRPAYRGWLSIEKLSDAFSIHRMRLGDRISSWVFDPDPRHLRYENRKRPNYWQSINHSLT